MNKYKRALVACKEKQDDQGVKKSTKDKGLDLLLVILLDSKGSLYGSM